MMAAGGDGIQGSASPPQAQWAFAVPITTIRLPGIRMAVADLAAFGRQAPLRFLTYLLVAFSFLAMSLPGIDLAVSGWFAAPSGGFPLADDDTLLLIRDLNRLVPKVLIPGLLAVLMFHALRPNAGWLIRPHQALFVIGAYGIACGTVVHALKNVIGRARPHNIAEFGGSEAFSVAWQWSEACQRNCSFSSGEGASAMALLSTVMLVPKVFRRTTFLVLVPPVVLFSLNRIAFGSHFLSDVVISWLLVAMVMVALWRYISGNVQVIDRAIIGAGLPLIAVAERALAVRRLRSSPSAQES